MTFRIGFLIFPEIMQLDMTGPYEVFTKLPDTEVKLIWKDLEPVTVAGGMRILPDVTFENGSSDDRFRTARSYRYGG